MPNKVSVKSLLLISLLFYSITLYAGSTNIKGLNVKSSAFSVSETVARLENILTKKGITVFANIDHAAGAKKIGSNLPATQLLIFGNPKLGTPLLQNQQTAGIDLPLKAIVWEDSQGKVWLGYNDPSYISNRHEINGQEKIIDKMTGALKKFTDYATVAK